MASDMPGAQQPVSLSASLTYSGLPLSLPNPNAEIVIRMLVDFSAGNGAGNKRGDGQPWPAFGGTITVTALEAHDLVANRNAAYVSG